MNCGTTEYNNIIYSHNITITTTIMIISLFIIHDNNIRTYTIRERGSPSTPPKGYYNNMCIL